ncbi:MAG: hypothetical protein ACYS8W_20480, partial [Planctomycetota bacterium]
METDGDSAFHGPVHASIIPGAPNPIDDPSLYVNGGSTDDTDLPFIPPVPHGPTMPGGVEILPGVVMYNTGCSNIILLEIFAEAPILVSSVNHEGMPCTRIDLPGCGHIVTGSMPALPEMQITLEPLGAHVSMRLLEADLRGVQAVEDMMFNAPAIEQVVTGHIPPSEAKPGERRGAGWKDRRARFRWSRPVWTEVTEDREVPYGYGGIHRPGDRGRSRVPRQYSEADGAGEAGPVQAHDEDCPQLLEDACRTHVQRDARARPDRHLARGPDIAC